LKAVVLLSGGLDSVVNFKCALDEGEVLRALTCDYGQAAFEGEAAAAAACASRYKVPLQMVDLGWYRTICDSPLIAGGPLAPVTREDLDAGRRHMLEETYIPNRNAVLVNVAAAFAEALGADTVVAGFNREEAELYPDNSAEFVSRTNAALEVSTLAGVRVVSYTLGLDKRETVALALETGAPLELVYSCYERPRDGLMCGTCQSCVRLKRALESNGRLKEHLGRFAG
jgi:7-cyano-7-deazaguanine synthase